MDSSSIFTRKKMGLDYRVWLVMVLCIVLSAGLLAYNVTGTHKPKPCRTMTISVNGQAITANSFFYTGNPVMFRLPVSEDDKVIWNFGDVTSEIAGISRSHAFNAESVYRVRATVNGTCTYEAWVSIKNIAFVLRDTTGAITENIISKEETVAGDSMMFSTTLPATSYEWYIENNSNYPVQTGKKASFTFGSKGSYMVMLVLDHNRDKKFSKQINVSGRQATAGSDAPPTPRILIPLDKHNNEINPPPQKVDSTNNTPLPTLKRKIFLTDEQFKNYLQSFACGEMAAEDFDAYLCQGKNTPVVLNNKDRKTLGTAVEDLKNNKIESVTAGRDSNDNCVIVLTVSYKKIAKIHFGRKPCSN